MSDLDPTEITEQMRTFHAEDVAEQFAWKLHSPMWRTISARFYNQHSIDLRQHVKSIVKVNPTAGGSGSGFPQLGTVSEKVGSMRPGSLNSLVAWEGRKTGRDGP